MASMTPDLPPPESATISSISPAKVKVSGVASMATPYSARSVIDIDRGAR